MWLGKPYAVPTIEIFEECLRHNPDAFNNPSHGFAKMSEAKTRQQLTGQIIDLLAGKGKGHDAFTLKQEEKRLQTFTIPALRVRLSDLQMKAKMASTDLGTLKRFVAESHRDDRPFPGWPTLPSQMVPRGGIYSLNVNAEYLNQLARTDIYEFKRLVRLYGSEQIDARRGLK
jgi:hypothetical protein